MTRKTTSINHTVAVLWASAFVITAMIIMQAGRLQGSTAHAGQVESAGGYTLLTARSGKGTETDPFDLLYILDDRSDMLLVYEIDNIQSNRINLRYAQNVAEWFAGRR